MKKDFSLKGLRERLKEDSTLLDGKQMIVNVRGHDLLAEEFGIDPQEIGIKFIKDCIVHVFEPHQSRMLCREIGLKDDDALAILVDKKEGLGMGRHRPTGVHIVQNEYNITNMNP